MTLSEHGRAGITSIEDLNYRASQLLSDGTYGWYETIIYSTANQLVGRTHLLSSYQLSTICLSHPNHISKDHMTPRTSTKMSLGNFLMVQHNSRDVEVASSSIAANNTTIKFEWDWGLAQTILLNSFLFVISCISH